MSVDGVAGTLDLLRKVLALEQKQGHRNSAATGGVYRYFKNQFDKHEYTDPALVAAVESVLAGLKRYEAMGSVAERHTQAEILLRRLDEMNGAAPGHSAPAVPVGPVSAAHRSDSAELARVRGGALTPNPSPCARERRGWAAPSYTPSPIAERETPALPIPHPIMSEEEPSAVLPTRPRSASFAMRPVPFGRTGPPVAAATAGPAGQSQAKAQGGSNDVTAQAPLSRAQGEGPGVRASSLAQPLREVLKIRAQELVKLERLGILTVEDALYHLPRDHYDCRDPLPIHKLKLGLQTTLVGTVQDVSLHRTPRKFSIVEAKIADKTGVIRVSWFQQHMAALLRPRVGQRIAISGHTELSKSGRLVFVPRDYEFPDEDELTHTGRLVPLYPLTEGLTQRWLRGSIKRALDAAREVIEEPLPAELRATYALPPLTEALFGYHFPADEAEKAAAVRRLAFDDLLCVSIGMARRKRAWQESAPAYAIPADPDLLAAFRSSLPFALTGAQERALAVIVADLSRTAPMSRLLQGDVGSGKTVVAAAALLLAARAGYQGAMMAPTEILAEQHARSITALLAPFLEPLGRRVELLTGAVTGARRRAINEGVASGEVAVLVGTHALIQEGVEFKHLALAVVDEQHRFGVEQRGLLRRKGFNPHMLAMTATPIPRTLTLTIYGDLDVAVIDERPPGRLPVATTWETSESSAFKKVAEEVARGRQAYVICPLVQEPERRLGASEEKPERRPGDGAEQPEGRSRVYQAQLAREQSDKADARAAVTEHKRLQKEVFPTLRVGLLHGQMKSAEKEATLTTFRDGGIDVLVATSVVEVGIDVPNATVMVVQQANRFGLAQLHQFRGRVGRGAARSYCLLLAESVSAVGQQRLQAITSTDDGFALAEVDLRLRGPGEFWGTRQSGLPDMRAAGSGDMRTIEEAREAAQRLVADDPDLARPEHRLLAGRVERFWHSRGELS